MNNLYRKYANGPIEPPLAIHFSHLDLKITFYWIAVGLNGECTQAFIVYIQEAKQVRQEKNVGWCNVLTILFILFLEALQGLDFPTFKKLLSDEDAD